MPGVAQSHPRPLPCKCPRRVHSAHNFMAPYSESGASSHLLAASDSAESRHQDSVDHYARPKFGRNRPFTFAGPVDRIKVVGDDSEIVDVTRIVLEAARLEVIPARSSQEALQKVASTQPDPILIDISIPGIDGCEILKMLKVDEETRRISVAMFSIKLEVRDKVLGLKEGVFDYITKPFSCDELLDRVGRIAHQLSAGEGG
jgi:CheY-like chemotaxis protein